jgi:hypothetical protein
MRGFFLAYPIVNALRSELSWTHYRILLRAEKPAARAFYEVEAVEARWSTRELERQISALLFERLALSRDMAPTWRPMPCTTRFRRTAAGCWNNVIDFPRGVAPG